MPRLLTRGIRSDAVGRGRRGSTAASLSNEAHRFIESRGLRFVLLGSSARKLKQAGTNVLAGSALRRVMNPLVPQELGTDFDLNEGLRFGTLPVIWQSPTKADSLEA